MTPDSPPLERMACSSSDVHYYAFADTVPSVRFAVERPVVERAALFTLLKQIGREAVYNESVRERTGRSIRATQLSDFPGLQLVKRLGTNGRFVPVTQLEIDETLAEIRDLLDDCYHVYMRNSVEQFFVCLKSNGMPLRFKAEPVAGFRSQEHQYTICDGPLNLPVYYWRTVEAVFDWLEAPVEARTGRHGQPFLNSFLAGLGADDVVIVKYVEQNVPVSLDEIVRVQAARAANSVTAAERE